MFYNQRNVCEVPAKLEGRSRDTLPSLNIKEKNKGIEIWALILNHSSAVLVHTTRKIKESLRGYFIFNTSKVFIIIYTVDIDLIIGKLFTEILPTLVLHFPYYKYKFHYKFKFY